MEGPKGESTAVVEGRVASARRVQSLRGGTNAELHGRDLREAAAPDEEGRELLRRILDRGMLSARARDSTLRVARTIADLEGAETIQAQHVAEAVTFRVLDWSHPVNS